jgi:GNAT superfamily N-acetyltransferase
MHYDSDDERGSTLVSATLGAEIAARFGRRNELPLSILAYDGDALVGGLNGVTHWGWCYIRHFWVEQSFRSRGVGRRLLAHISASAFTLIHSIRAQHNSMSVVAFCVLVTSMIFYPDTRGYFYTKSYPPAEDEDARRDRWRAETRLCLRLALNVSAGTARFRQLSGKVRKHMLVASFSRADPTRT